MTATPDPSASVSLEEPAPVLPDTITVPDGEIPLPPEEMWAELDNSEADGPEAREAEGDGAPRKAIEPEVAALEFVGDAKPFRVVPLTYPFRWNGVVHTEIVVRRMTVRELIEFWDGLPEDRTYDRTDAYGVMCGLPASVLRALPDVDGLAVNGACLDFLPRELGGGSD